MRDVRVCPIGTQMRRSACTAPVPRWWIVRDSMPVTSPNERVGTSGTLTSTVLAATTAPACETLMEIAMELAPTWTPLGPTVP